METLVTDDPVITLPTLHETTVPQMSFWQFLARAVIVVVLLSAAGSILLGFNKTKTPVISNPSISIPTKEDPKKIGFTFTDQWNKIEIPNGQVVYSRCDPYVSGVRWVVDPAGDMSSLADPSCKKS